MQIDYYFVIQPSTDGSGLKFYVEAVKSYIFDKACFQSRYLLVTPRMFYFICEKLIAN